MRSNNSLLKKVCDAQIKFPSKGDLVSEITSALKELQINKTFKEEEKIFKKETYLTWSRLLLKSMP